MDAKEVSLIRRHRDRIATGEFGESDVFALLTLLRPLAAPGSPVHEFANFIAHREKDRGLIRDYLWRTKDFLDNLGKVSGVMEIKPVFSRDQIGDSVNGIFRKIGLDGFSEGQIDQIVVCVISLLQDVRILDKKGQEMGVLLLACTAEELQLLGKVRVQDKVDSVFPVLVAPNSYIPGPEGDTPAPTALVEVHVAGGKLTFRPAVATAGVK